MDDKGFQNLPILTLIPADIPTGDQPAGKVKLEEVEEKEEKPVKGANKDNCEADALGGSSLGIFEKKPRGRPKGSKRAEENCSCSNCVSWREHRLLSVQAHDCGQCGKMFRVWGHYKAHMIGHGTTRPHCCTECSKSFVRLEDLRRHFGTHGADFKFECQKCKKQFLRADNLKSHTKWKCGRTNSTTY